MLKLLFNLRHQAISLTNPGAIVATDSKNYLVAKFNMLSDDWDMPLSAIFTNANDSIAYTILVGQEAELEDNECYVPWEVLTTSGDVYVSVFCGSLHTTNTAVFHVVQSGYAEGEIPPPPTPTIYEQMLRMIEEIREAKQNKLTAGENITITEDDVISAVAGIDEAKVLEILDNTLSGNLEATPSLLIDNVVNETYNPNGDLIMYYIDSEDVRHNIFNFSPYLGTKDYNALQNRPVVTGSNVSTSVNTVLEGYLNFESNSFLVSTYQDPDKEIDVDLAASVPNCWTANYPAERYDFNNITGTFARAGVFRIPYQSAANKPETINDIVGSCFIIQLVSPADNANMIRYIVGENANGQIVTYMQTAKLEKIRAFNYAVAFQLVWKKIGEKGDKGDDGFSPTISTTSEYLRTRVEITDVNGTQNIYINDGESVKSAVIDANGDLIITIKGKPTSGVRPTYPERIYNVGHVVGADGYSPTATVTQTQSGATVSITDKNGTTTANISNGVNGSDYILTDQDKSDIADLVLAELPTTQGVQYGNAGN